MNDADMINTGSAKKRPVLVSTWSGRVSDIAGAALVAAHESGMESIIEEEDRRLKRELAELKEFEMDMSDYSDVSFPSKHPKSNRVAKTKEARQKIKASRKQKHRSK